MSEIDTEKKRIPFEELPITVEGPLYIARIKGVPVYFTGETKMDAMRKAKTFQIEEPKRLRRGRAPTQEIEA